MTRKEAIKELENFKNESWDRMPEEVIDMAIVALSTCEGLALVVRWLLDD